MAFEVGAITGKIVLDDSQYKRAAKSVANANAAIAQTSKTANQAVAKTSSALNNEATAANKARDANGRFVKAGDAAAVALGDTGGAAEGATDALEDYGGAADDAIESNGNLSMATAMVGAAFMGMGAAVTAANGLMIKMAMDAEETANLYDVSVGKMKASTDAWIDNLNSNLGLARSDLQKMVGTFNVMLNSMGLVQSKANDMGKTLTKLAYDMASFYNIEVEEAFMKLQSGLSGEIEPLKRLGIIVNETTAKNWALTTGMIKQGEVMDEVQKVAARYGVILAQTSLAQGDLERTLDSATNLLRVTQGRIKDMAETIGAQLIPAVSGVLKVLGGALEQFQAMIVQSPQLAAGIGMASVAFGALALTLGSVAVAFGAATLAATAMGIALLPLIASVAGAVGIVAGISLLVGVLYSWRVNQKALRAELEESWKVHSKNVDKISELEGQYNALKENEEETGETSKELRGVVDKLTEAYKRAGLTLDDINGKYGGLSSKARQLAEDELKHERAVIGIALEGIEKEYSALYNKLEKPGLFKGPIQGRMKELAQNAQLLSDKLIVIREEIIKLHAPGATKISSFWIGQSPEDAARELANIEAITDVIGKRDSAIRAELRTMRKLRETVHLSANENVKWLEKEKKLLIELGELSKKEAKEFTLSDAIGKTDAELRAYRDQLIELSRDANTTANELGKLEKQIEGVNEKLGESVKSPKINIKAISEIMKPEDLMKTYGIESTSELTKKIADLNKAAIEQAGDPYALKQINAELDSLNIKLGTNLSLTEKLNLAGFETDEQIQKQIRAYQDLLGEVEDNARATEYLLSLLSEAQNKLSGSAPMTFFEQMKAAGLDMQGALESGFQNLLVDGFNGKLTSAKEAFRSFAQTIVQQMAQIAAARVAAGIFGAMFGVGGGAAGMAGLMAGLSGKDNSYADGIESVPYTGDYKLHSGEKVVPAYDAQKTSDAQPIIINNYVTDIAIAQSMASKSGKNVINNVIVASAQGNQQVRGIMRNA